MDEAERISLIEPFYLDLMRLNAIEYGDRLAPSIVRRARSLSPLDVIELIPFGWRERVMAAWFGVTFDDADVTKAVLDGLALSQGDLDAPPLAVASVVLAGDAALPALEEYLSRDGVAEWGAGGFVAAAIESLPGGSSSSVVAEADRAAFGTLEALARRLRGS